MKKTGRKGIIDLQELDRYLKSGKTQSEYANMKNITRASVSMATKKLRGAVTSEIALRAGPAIVAADLKAIEQFTKINDETNKTIDRIGKYLDGTKKTSMSEAEATALLYKGISEVRQQLKLQQSMIETLTDFNELQNFQKTVLGVLFEIMDPTQRKEAIRRLKENRVARSSLKFEGVTS